MKIRKILVIVFSISIFIFSGCKNQDNEKVVKTESETLETEKIKTEKIETVNSETTKEDEEKVVRTEAEILEIVNNEAAKEKLVKNSYEIDLSSMFNIDGSLSLEELDLKYPIECIRKNQLGYYVILKDVKDEWYYFLFSNEEGKYMASDLYHYKNSIYKSDFEKIKEEVSTLADVREIDPYGNEMFSMETGQVPFSSHRTLDGYKIRIDYDTNAEDEEDYIVKSISIFLLPNDSIINNLIKVDELK